MDLQHNMLKQILNKVPEVTLYFWIIKILGTTIGETAADFLNVNLNLGLSGTSVVTGILLVIALFFQFRSKKYTPSIYWTSVVLISVFGTLVTDNLTDKFGIPLQVSTLIFTVLLALTFAIWYLKEKTLSIHSIFTRRREAFYWLTILFAFALGTASGDLMAEGLGLGYLLTGIIVAVTIAAISLAWKLRLNSILSFWLIYILTRPLGVSIGDLLSQPHKYGGLGLGATITSLIFLIAILVLVVFLTITKKDVTTEETIRKNEQQIPERGHVISQVVVTLLLFAVLSGGGYYFRQKSLAPEAVSSASHVNGTATSTATTSPLGDVSNLKTIVSDTLNFVIKNDIAGANNRVNDLEHEWDTSQSRLRPVNPAKWTEVDGKIDKVLRELRATSPNAASSKTALEALLTSLSSSN